MQQRPGDEELPRRGGVLTLAEVIQVRQQDVCVVGRRQPHHVVFAHLAQGLSVQRLEERDVHLFQDVLLNGPVQPLPHVVLGPDLRIWNQRQKSINWRTSCFRQRNAQLGSSKT